MEPLTPERRRQQTRDYLLAAASQVFAERGFHGATLDEVAAVAGFTKGAVYSNFRSKEDLFLALFEANYERETAALLAVLEDRAELAPGAGLATFVALIREQVRQSGSHFALLQHEFVLFAARNPEARRRLAQVDDTYVAVVADLLAAERDRRRLPPLADPERTSRVIHAVFRGLSQLSLVEPEALDDELLAVAVEFVARALGAAPETDDDAPTGGAGAG
ncbi:MAG TPA: TetR/AcrR family transcriptional regulator [Acidimicrobiales bacterium]|nr:TetR/AcrR family transcriptional regulator [Acidimicrobiales bacterium]